MDFPAFRERLLAIADTVDTDDIGSLYKGLERYIQLCGETGVLIGNNALYTALGISRVTICTWLRGTRRQNNPEYRKFAELVKQICGAAREQYGVEGIVDPILTIWHQKFYDGFVDDPPREEAHDPLGELPDQRRFAKMMEKYANENT